MVKRNVIEQLEVGDIVHVILVEQNHERAGELDDSLVGSRVRGKVHLKGVVLLPNSGFYRLRGSRRMPDPMHRYIVLYHAESRGFEPGIRDIQDGSHLVLPTWAIDALEVVGHASS